MSRRIAASFVASLMVASSAWAADDINNADARKEDAPKAAPPENQPADVEGTRTVQQWSQVSGTTAGNGKDLIGAEVGWPALQAAYFHGMTDGFDLGARFGLFWGTEGFAPTGFGLRAQAALRWQIPNATPYKMTIEVDPGVYTGFGYFGGFAQFGLAATGRYTVAFPITSALTLHAGADIPLIVDFLNGGGASIPIMVGGGAEYFINDAISITLRLRFGVAINVGDYSYNNFFLNTGGANANFATDCSVGAAFKI